jgi:hypothetical protein
MKGIIKLLIVLSAALFAGCESEQDQAKDFVVKNFKEALGDKYQSFVPQRVVVEEDNSNRTRYKVYGIVQFNGKTIQEAYGVAQHNKVDLGDGLNWVWGGCNCIQIWSSADNNSGVAGK